MMDNSMLEEDVLAKAEKTLVKQNHKPFTDEDIAKVKHIENNAVEDEKKGFGVEEYKALAEGKAAKNIKYWASRLIEQFDRKIREQTRLNNTPVTLGELNMFKQQMIQVIEAINTGINQHIRLHNSFTKAIMDKGLITEEDMLRASQEIRLENSKSPCETCVLEMYSAACGDRSKMKFVPEVYELITDDEFKNIVLECEHYVEKPKPEPVEETAEDNKTVEADSESAAETPKIL